MRSVRRAENIANRANNLNPGLGFDKFLIDICMFPYIGICSGGHMKLLMMLNLIDFELIRLAVVLMEEDDSFGSKVVNAYYTRSLLL